VRDWPDFRAALQRSLSDGGLQVVEVPTERARNVELHRRVWPAVSRTLADGLPVGAA
jgi:2-succinyl-5-enolpyruvyl-6-hydroxy-3-cyclohexene-1-carboxylate synthase